MLGEQPMEVDLTLVFAQALSDREKGQAIGSVVGLFIGLAIGLGFVFWWIRKLSKVPVAASVHPCPRCGESEIKPVAYTWWGGALGPKMLSQVYCLHCKTQFNSKTGKYNTLGIIIYLAVTFVLVLFLTLAALYFVLNSPR